MLFFIDNFKFLCFTHLNEISLIGEVDTSLSPYVYFSFSPNFNDVVYIHK